MIKILLIVALSVTVSGCRLECPTNVTDTPLICAIDVGAATCHLYNRCRLNAENCSRVMQSRPVLTVTDHSRCRKIQKTDTSGPCARRPFIRPTCRRLICTNTSPLTMCYGTNKNNCGLLTFCEMQRLNCHRGIGNHLKMVDQKYCAGLRPGQVAKCKYFQ